MTYSLPTAWESAVTGWLDWLTASGASVETIRVRRGIIRCVAYRGQTDHPDQVTADNLISMLARQRWSADHRRNVRATLTRFFGWCRQHGVTADDPSLGLPKMAGSKPHPRPAPDTIWRDLLHKAQPRERLMARLAGEAGLRRGEISKVHTDDLIEDLLGWSLMVRGKGDKQRLVPLTDSLAQAIRDHPGYGYLFPGQIGGHISPGHVGVLISRLMPPGWSCHKLRHRYASRGLAGTGDLIAVQQALGHVSVATTQRYVAVSNAQVRAVSEAAA